MISFLQFIENKNQPISSDDVLEMVRRYHHTPEDLDSGDLYNRIKKYDFYRSEEVPSDKIDAEIWNSDPDMVEEIEELIKSKPNYPPIVLDEDFVIIDGTHRAKALKNLGHSFIKAYVPA